MSNHLDELLRERMQAQAWSKTPGEEIDRLAQDITSGLEKGRVGAPLPHTYTVYRFLGIAAVIIIAIVGIKYVPQLTSTPEKSHAYTTAYGQQARVTLADGSVVQLAPGSKLTASVSSKNREINLEGEALFAVNTGSRVPFTVRAGNMVTRVLGTSFGVRHYDTDTSVRVIVAEGKVSLGATVLAIGDVGEARGNGEISVRHEANIAELLSWTNGHLAIKNMKMRDVVPIISRWYGIDIELATPELAELPFTSTMSTTARPAAVIDVIATTLGARAKVSGRSGRGGTTVTLYRDSSSFKH